MEWLERFPIHGENPHVLKNVERENFEQARMAENRKQRGNREEVEDEEGDKEGAHARHDNDTGDALCQRAAKGMANAGRSRPRHGLLEDRPMPQRVAQSAGTPGCGHHARAVAQDGLSAPELAKEKKACQKEVEAARANTMERPVKWTVTYRGKSAEGRRNEAEEGEE